MFAVDESVVVNSKAVIVDAEIAFHIVIGAAWTLAQIPSACINTRLYPGRKASNVGCITEYT